MKFSCLTKCPFCGCEEFYTIQRPVGNVYFNQRFDGKEADNSDMYEYLSYDYSHKCYCRNCEEYLGNKETDTVSKKAEKALKSKE